MQRKSSGWLRKMRELGLGRHGFGGWMSGTEMIVQRGLGMGEVQGQRVSVQGVRSGQGNNVYQMLPKHSSVHSPKLQHAPTLPPQLIPFTNLENDLWELRKQLVIQIAKRRNGKVRLQEVAAECNVNIRIAAEWLKRLSLEGMLSLVAGQQNVIVYSMKDVRHSQK